MHHLHFNFWAILVSALFQWLLGAVWYSPALFAKPWMEMAGVHPNANKKNRMMVGMVASFVGSLVTSFMLAQVVMWAGAETYYLGALIGFILWLGFIAAPLSASYIYEGRPIDLFAINAGYWMVGLSITGGLLAVWH
jgi:Protein of unknown function (DUF1761)